MNSALKPTLFQNNAAAPGLVKSVLTEDMLERFASRAAAYDRENRFFTEDFEELRATKVSSIASAAGIRWRRHETG